MSGYGSRFLDTIEDHGSPDGLGCEGAKSQVHRVVAIRGRLKDQRSAINKVSYR